MKLYTTEKTLDLGILGERECSISFYWYKGQSGDYWNPPEPEEIEIHSVLFEGMNITDYILEDVIDEIETEILEMEHE